MFASIASLVLAAATAGVMAQGTSPGAIFNQTGRLPAGCVDGYSAGTDTVLYTVPYTYTQVLSIIGSFKNLTWSGNPDNTVTLNGTDNTVGTARMYDTAGAHVTETITVYEKPAAGPYVEVHTLAPLSIPAANLSFYADFDGTTATEACNGAATAFNFTISFCATNVTSAAAVLHKLHLTDATTVGLFLGGRNFTSCAAINSTPAGNSTSTPTGRPAATTGSPPAVPFTGGARDVSAASVLASLGALMAFLM